MLFCEEVDFFFVSDIFFIFLYDSKSFCYCNIYVKIKIKYYCVEYLLILDIL